MKPGSLPPVDISPVRTVKSELKEDGAITYGFYLYYVNESPSKPPDTSITIKKADDNKYHMTEMVCNPSSRLTFNNGYEYVSLGGIGSDEYIKNSKRHLRDKWSNLPEFIEGKFNYPPAVLTDHTLPEGFDYWLEHGMDDEIVILSGSAIKDGKLLSYEYTFGGELTFRVKSLPISS